MTKNLSVEHIDGHLHSAQRSVEVMLDAKTGQHTAKPDAQSIKQRFDQGLARDEPQLQARDKAIDQNRSARFKAAFPK